VAGLICPTGHGLMRCSFYPPSSGVMTRNHDDLGQGWWNYLVECSCYYYACGGSRVLGHWDVAIVPTHTPVSDNSLKNT
jgi:hypothetical protein